MNPALCGIVSWSSLFAEYLFRGLLSTNVKVNNCRGKFELSISGGFKQITKILPFI